jgi:hypothetical protein
MDYRGKSIQQHPHIVDTNENSGDEEYWSENLSTGSQGSQIILLPITILNVYMFTFKMVMFSPFKPLPLQKKMSVEKILNRN